MQYYREKILGVVFAGGQSRRMGRDKAAIVLPDGRTCLEKAFAEIKKTCGAALVSCANGRPYAGFPCLEDRVDGAGPVGGLAAVLEYAEKNEFAAAVIMACDLPLLRGELFQNLINCYFARCPNPLAAVFQAPDGKLEMLAAIYSIAALPLLREAMGKGHLSLKRIFSGESVLKMPYAIGDAEYFLNFNTPADQANVFSRYKTYYS